MDQCHKGRRTEHADRHGVGQLIGAERRSDLLESGGRVSARLSDMGDRDACAFGKQLCVASRILG